MKKKIYLNNLNDHLKALEVKNKQFEKDLIFEEN